MKLTYQDELQGKTCISAKRGSRAPGRFAGFSYEVGRAAAGRRRNRA
jgi:hypothetical protein